MPNIINASTSSGLVQTADTSGTIDFQSSGATKLTVSTAGTSIAQYTPATSLITSGTAVASTSGTSINFTDIPSWVKRITVMFQGVSTSGTSNIQVQIGSGSVTTSGYVSSIIGGSSGNALTGATATSGFLCVQQLAAAYLNNGQVVITSANTNLWVASSVMTTSTGGAGSMAGGSITLGGTLDRIRITTVNGTDTFDAGSINIQYE
jgi:hypothetical protein